MKLGREWIWSYGYVIAEAQFKKPKEIKFYFPLKTSTKNLGQNYSKFTLNCIKKQISSNFSDIGI
jgi:mRNA-degrading endonuclease HigB of HigAB toxin-antitoxin module